MSCNACRAAQEFGEVAFYRVGDGNVKMSGCKEHLRAAMQMLRTQQGDVEPNTESSWKYDEMKQIRYIVIGSYIVLAQNMVIKNFNEPTVLGEVYIAFHCERTFSDGSVCLSERGTVSGGISIDEAKKLVEELKRAIKMVEAGEVK